jgi:hypothetical protein
MTPETSYARDVVNERIALLKSNGLVARLVGHTDVVPGNSALGFDADPVVHGGSDSLPAAEVALRRLNRDVPKKELNLF